MFKSIFSKGLSLKERSIIKFPFHLLPLLNWKLTLNVNIIQNFSSSSNKFLKYIPIITDNKITVSHKMNQVIEKIKLKPFKSDKQNNNNLLISASVPKFNHRIGQHYSKFNPEIHLFSSNWIKRGTIGKYFTINPIGNHPALSPDQNKTFIDIGLDINLAERLKQTSKNEKKMIIEKPSRIQEITFNEIFPKPKAHLMLTAETGGGKTLAYILPILQSCIQLKRQLDSDQTEMSLKRSSLQPICIILVPSRELAFQVYDVIAKLINKNEDLKEKLVDNNDETNEDSDSLASKKFVKDLEELKVFIDLHHKILENKENVSKKNVPKLNDVYKVIYNDDHNDNELDDDISDYYSTKLDIENNKEQIINRNELLDENKQVDILITTPSELKKRLEKTKKNNNKTITSTFLRHLVIDEADTLLDDSFNDVLITVLKKLYLNLNLSPETDNILKDSSTQLILSSATIPRDMRNILKDIINCDGDEFKSLVTNRVNYVMTHISQKFIRTSVPERDKLLIELINSELKNDKAIRTIIIFSHRTKTATYVWKMLKENNIDADLLVKDTKQRELIVENFLNKRERRILVATDIASRGWDTQHVNHVINYEMPHFIADYIHRCGRVGRIGCHKSNGSGPKVTSFITRAFEVDMVMNIEKSVRLDSELNNVNANISRILKFKYLDRNINN